MQWGAPTKAWAHIHRKMDAFVPSTRTTYLIVSTQLKSKVRFEVIGRIPIRNRRPHGGWSNCPWELPYSSTCRYGRLSGAAKLTYTARESFQQGAWMFVRGIASPIVCGLVFSTCVLLSPGSSTARVQRAAQKPATTANEPARGKYANEP